jgi:hypothetical protein
MTDLDTSGAVTASSDERHIPDPDALTTRDGVDVSESTYPHEDFDHCEADSDGRVVVGVTTDAGEVLLQVHESEDHVLVPNEVVADGDWDGAARRAAEQFGVPVELDGVERVRVVDHVEVDERPEDHSDVPDDAPVVETTHHVVVGASVATADVPEPSADDDEWTVGWYDELPVDVPDDASGDSLDDIRTFLE